MKKRLGIAFWSESIVGSIAAFLAVLTLAWPDWIEGVFRVDPDNHSGSLEWAVAVGFIVAAAVCAALARREWHRAVPVGS